MGGHYGDATLVVAVQEPAVDGRATDAALKAVAKTFGVRVGNVRLVSGATSRTKILEVEGDHAAQLAELLDA